MTHVMFENICIYELSRRGASGLADHWIVKRRTNTINSYFRYNTAEMKGYE